MVQKMRSYIPEELIFKIFLSLPVKSLVRFNSVCKLWRSIISNPQFIRTHLTTYVHKNEASLVMCMRYKDLDPVKVFTPDHEDSITLDLPPVKFRDGYLDVCSCNGLVCLSDAGGYTVCIWNPSTKRFKILPTPGVHFKTPTPEKKFQIIDYKLGFIYESIYNDYKLLKFSHVICREFGGGVLHKPVLKVQLFFSNADSWKEILVPTTIQNFMLDSDDSQVLQFENGLMYLNSGKELLSFDWHDEVFEVYPFPINEYKLTFEGSVAMIFESWSRSNLGIWMLDGGKVWIKTFDLEAGLKINWIFLYMGDGQFVAKNDVEYILYDYKKKDAKKFLSQTPPPREYTSVVKYTESLVSPEGFVSQE